MLKLAAIVILGATLIDGSGRAPLKDSAIIIEGDSIVAALQHYKLCDEDTT